MYRFDAPPCLLAPGVAWGRRLKSGPARNADIVIDPLRFFKYSLERSHFMPSPGGFVIFASQLGAAMTAERTLILHIGTQKTASTLIRRFLKANVDRLAESDIRLVDRATLTESPFFGYLEKVTSGASSDIKQCTGMARAMATQYGMSDELGPLLYGENEEEVFLGHSVARSQHVSEKTQELVDREVKRFVNEGYDTAQKVIREHIDDLHKIAQALLEYETLTGDEIRGLMNGEMPLRETDTDPVPRASSVPTAGKTTKKRPGPDAAPGGPAPKPHVKDIPLHHDEMSLEPLR